MGCPQALSASSQAFPGTLLTCVQVGLFDLNWWDHPRLKLKVQDGHSVYHLGMESALVGSHLPSLLSCTEALWTPSWLWAPHTTSIPGIYPKTPTLIPQALGGLAPKTGMPLWLGIP